MRRPATIRKHEYYKSILHAYACVQSYIILKYIRFFLQRVFIIWYSDLIAGHAGGMAGNSKTNFLREGITT